jgi:hypothetical protein
LGSLPLTLCGSHTFAYENLTFPVTTFVLITIPP